MSNISFTEVHSPSPASSSIEKENVLKERIAGFPMSHLMTSLSNCWMRCVCKSPVKKIICVTDEINRCVLKLHVLYLFSLQALKRENDLYELAKKAEQEPSGQPANTDESEMIDANRIPDILTLPLR